MFSQKVENQRNCLLRSRRCDEKLFGSVNMVPTVNPLSEIRMKEGN